MRFFSPGSSFLAAIVTMASCQPAVVQPQTVPTQTRAAVSGPISLDHPVIDLGKVRQGETKPFSVMVRNHTDKLLSFQGFRSTCSCSNLQAVQKELQSGGEAKVEGVFRGQGAYGSFNRSIEIQWGDVKPVVLTLTGEVYRDLVIEPEGLVLAPEPLAQRADEGQMVIHNRGSVPVRFQLSDLPAGIQVEAASTAIAAQSSMMLKIKALPQLLVKEQLQLAATTDHPQEHRITIPLLVQPRNSIQVYPPAFHWGLLSTKDWQARMPLDVKLSGPAFRQCRVIRIELPEYLQQVSQTGSPENQQHFRFTARTDTSPADLNGNIVFHLEVNGHSPANRLVIPLSGLLRDSQSLRSMR
ncbi:MAG: DUF1573 domain-containing protein [Gemmatales bacterium]